MQIILFMLQQVSPGGGSGSFARFSGLNIIKL